jgi:uncharacterized membrane protein YhaH (DUF805 family)
MVKTMTTNDMNNPYGTPQASLGTQGNVEGYDETSAFSAKGRFGRATYLVYSMGVSIVGMLIVGALMGVTAAVAGDGAKSFIPIITILFYILLIPVSFIFMIRRLHDLDWSGWLSLLSFVPLINLGIAIPMLFFRGTEGANKYGLPPRPVRGHVYIAIVLALIFVVGILAAIAIPAYQEYVLRAQQM